MNRIETLFKHKKNDILSVYFTAGFPKAEDMESIILELSRQGADMIEIGIPFSDPMADGMVIQQSSAQALKNGMTLEGLFTRLSGIREKVSVPWIMMGYLNPVIQYGPERFCRKCVETGVDGIIIPDLPFGEYVRDYKPLEKKYGLRFVMLITPETSEERIRLIDTHTNGFIYMVSTAATTGEKERFGESTLNYFERIRKMKLKNPLLIGFGISNRETFRGACSYGSGAIVGSSFIRLLGEAGTIEGAVSGLWEKLGKSQRDRG